jgi:hypothetical protein
LLIESSWHARRLQALGFLQALLPALAMLPQRRAALERHVAVFGTNIFVAPALVAAVARLEREQDGERAVQVRDTLAAPLSGAADLFYWGALRPAASTCGMVALLAGSAWLAAALACGLFAVPALAGRWRAFRAGAGAGGDLVAQQARARPPRAWIGPLRAGVALGAGVILGWCARAGWERDATAVFHMGLALLVGYHARRRLLSPGIAFLVLIALGALARRVDLLAFTWR